MGATSPQDAATHACMQSHASSSVTCMCILDQIRLQRLCMHDAFIKPARGTPMTQSSRGRVETAWQQQLLKGFATLNTAVVAVAWNPRRWRQPHLAGSGRDEVTAGEGCDSSMVPLGGVMALGVLCCGPATCTPPRTVATSPLPGHDSRGLVCTLNPTTRQP